MAWKLKFVRNCFVKKAGSNKRVAELQLRFRIWIGGEIALGPGKVDLLDRIAATGSIRKAALELDMSYMRAWSLVRTMNNSFKSPLVDVNRGGRARGGASLTRAGEQVLEIYRAMEVKSRTAVVRDWKRLDRLMKN